jgi:hypothetical protein
MKYIPFFVRVAIVLTLSAFIAKWLGVSFSSIFMHVLWLALSAVVYVAAAGAHLALERFMTRRHKKQE